MAHSESSLESAADQLGSAAERAAGGAAGGAMLGAMLGAGGAMLGAVGAAGVVAAETALLHAIGFTAQGPAAGSSAAGWMSSIALANGVGVSAGSLYATAQAGAMGGAALLGAPFVVTCAAAGAFAMAVIRWFK